MDGLDPVSARSKLLFNNQHMLVVCRWVAACDGVFCASDIVTATNVASTTVHRILSVLTACGLLARLPRTPVERTQWYERAKASFWGAVDELVSGVRAESEVPA